MPGSQYGEHVPILEFFTGRRGRFLDVGAYNGVEFSNTLPLLDAGWAGTYVEPSAAPFASLIDNLGGRVPQPVFVNAAIHPHGGLIHWWDDHGKCLASYKQAQVQRWSHITFTPVLTCSITWEQLLAEAPGPYLFFNLDVEGNNSELMRLAPLDRIGAELICVENDPGSGDDVPAMMRYLEDHGYRLWKKIGGNLLWNLTHGR